MGNDNRSMLPFSGLAIFLAAMGISFFVQAPYKSFRPTETKVYDPLQKVPARLWQDPFRAVIDHTKAPETSHSVTVSGQCTLCAGRTQTQLVEPLVVNQFKGAINARRHITILGIMVSGGPYSEDTEQRIRLRYAALSALGRRGFLPKDPDHIDYMKITTDHRITFVRPLLTNITPFEWFIHSRNDEAVLLLWLNDDFLKEDPFTRLSRLNECLRGDDDRVHFRIIGPAGSDTLQQMIQFANFYSRDSIVVPHIQMFSAMATVDDHALYDPLMNLTGTSETTEFEIIWRLSKHGIEYARTIGTNQTIAESLINELSNRGIDPRKGDHIVLVGEMDTLYGRQLPEAFKKAMTKAIEGRLPDENVDNTLHLYTYMRGIDGIIPGNQEEVTGDQNGREAKKKEKEKDTDLEELKRIEQPTGRSQFDYLRRLALETKRLDQDLRIEDHERGIKAIGILGNDFYDKFLALQAFRQHFPRAIFFTTDLDARLLHPAYLPWTRNLVVASHFDLSLRKDKTVDLQGSVPPFRDSYQTALFYTILKIFTKENSPEKIYLDTLPPPLLFEIGRSQPVLLTDIEAKDGLAQPTVHRSENVRDIFLKWMWIIIIIIAIAFLILCFVHENTFTSVTAILSKNLRFVFLAVAVAMFLVCLFYYGILRNPREEPFFIMEGVSIWPTEMVRLFAVVLSVFFWRNSRRKLRENEELIRDDFRFAAYPQGQSNTLPWEKIALILPSLLSTVLNVKNWLTSFHGQWTTHPPNRQPIGQLWMDYLREDKNDQRTERVLILYFLTLALCLSILDAFNSPLRPARGAFSLWVDDKIIYLSGFAFTCLTFYVLDITRICRHFIRLAAEKGASWFGNNMLQELLRVTCLNCRTARCSKIIALEAWLIVRLVAKRTDAVGKLIFCPFIVWFILFLGRFDYFDNWVMSAGDIMVFTLCLVIVWSSAFLLRRSAERLRKSSLDRLRIPYAQAVAQSDMDGIRLFEFVVNEIRDTREGAFAPFSQHPAIQALFIPFGGVGGTYLLDFLNKLNI